LEALNFRWMLLLTAEQPMNEKALKFLTLRMSQKS
jgi:hypothetical protein